MFADSQTGPESSIVSAIADKFRLDKAEVQKVFDEQRTAKKTEREARVGEKLSQLVADGKLTQEQADKLSAKRAELKEQHKASRTMGDKNARKDRLAERSANKAELEDWAKDNGIDTQYLRSVMGGGRHGQGPGSQMK